MNRKQLSNAKNAMDTVEQEIAQPDKQQTWLGDVKVGVSGLRVIYCVIKHQKIVF